jgi:DNA-binding winged helix-turn-helix (wHTH) protein
MACENNYNLGEWRFIVQQNMLVRGKQTLTLKPLQSRLLAHFLHHANEVRSIDELKLQVWQQEFLTDGAVKKAISELRKVLTQTGLTQDELIVAEAHRAYRYVGPSEQSSFNIFTNIWPIALAISVLSVCLILFLMIPTSTNTITLVEKTRNDSSHRAETAYTQLVRTTLIGALSPHYSVRQLYSTPDGSELTLSYWIENEHVLFVTLLDENQQLLWEKRLTLNIEIHRTLQLFVQELSHLLKTPLKAPLLSSFTQPEAYELFVNGKISYYQHGLNSDKAEHMFKRSLQIQPDFNPSGAALLDIYGLRTRSKPLSERNEELRKNLHGQVKLLTDNRHDIAENSVALAKYQLVNRGDPAQALAIIEDASELLSNAYDLHIIAFAYALVGDKKRSDLYIDLAEQRFPQRNVVLWYKAMIHLTNGQLQDALIQSRWAQDVAPHWYPLNYVAPRLFSGQSQDAFEYLASFDSPLFDNNFAASANLSDYVDVYFDNIESKQWASFETEIAYLLARYYSKEAAEQHVKRYVNSHYPEKLMMLRMIDTWFTLYP